MELCSQQDLQPLPVPGDGPSENVLENPLEKSQNFAENLGFLEESAGAGQRVFGAEDVWAAFASREPKDVVPFPSLTSSTSMLEVQPLMHGQLQQPPAVVPYDPLVIGSKVNKPW